MPKALPTAATVPPSEPPKAGMTEQQKAENSVSKLMVPAIPVVSAKFTKGITLPAEHYGGDKYEMFRFDVELEVRGDNLAPFDVARKTYEIIDNILNEQISAEIDGIKSRKKR